MKKILFCVFVLVNINALLSQTYSTACDVNGYAPFSTDYLNSIYNPNQMPLNNPDLFKNGLDWNDITGFELEDMFFAGIPLDYMTALTSTQTSANEFYHYIYDGASAITKRHLSSEGWELLSVNLGRYPDAITQDQTVKFRSMPFIVLYNRYQGIIRVFVSMGPDKTINEAADAISVNLRIKRNNPSENLNGLLRLYDGYDQTLDQPTNVDIASTLSKAVNAQGDWASCDFQVTLDPCVCTYPSEMFLEFDHIKTQRISLYGRSVELGNINIMSNNLTLNPTGFLSGFNLKTLNPNSGEASAGIVIENTINSILDEYIKRYEIYQAEFKIANKHNEKVKQNLALLRFAKAAIVFAATYGSNIGDIATWDALKQQGLAFSLEYIANGEASTLDDGNWFTTVVNSLSSIGKKVNSQSKAIDEKELFKYLKMVLGEDGKQFITKNFELMGLPSEPVKPSNTIAYSEMRFEGDITTKVRWDGPLFATPGSFGTSVAQVACAGDNIFYYPNYNTPLGVFALLETPKIKISETIVDEFTKGEFEWESRIDIVNGSVFPPVYGTVWDVKSKRYQNWTKNYQYKLDKPLKFTFNNALDIKDYKIEAFLRVKNTTLPNYDGSINYSSAYIDPDYTTNMTSKDVVVDEYDKIFQKGYTATGLSFQEGSNHFQPEYIFQSSPTYIKSDFELNSVKLDINSIMNSVSSVGVKNEIIKENTIVLDASQPKPVLQNGQWVFPSFNQLNINYPTTVNTQNTGVTLIDTVELVLFVDVEFHSKNELGMNNTTTMILTYKIPININQDIQFSDLQPNLESSNLNISQYKENLNFSNTSFDGQQIEGCIINGNVYTCQAWNNITIDGDLTTSNGYIVQLKAGNEIIQQFESNVSAEISLEINPILDFTYPMPVMHVDSLVNYCQGNLKTAANYLANVAGKSSFNGISEEFSNLENENQISNNINFFSFSLYPNPTSNQVTVRFNQAFEGASISVTDVFGKEMQVRTHKTDQGFELSLDEFAVGVYLVTVHTPEGSITKQLVKK